MKPTSTYYSMAKMALQASSIVLAAMLVACIALYFVESDTKYFPFIISSAQGLSGICLGVMSYYLRNHQ